VVTSEEALSASVCNELTFDSLFLCRNIMGLWLLQQAREAWQRGGRQYSYEELVALAHEAPPGGPLVHPDDAGFLAPPDMPQAIRDYCLKTGQLRRSGGSVGTGSVSSVGAGAMTRCILESLALSYREALEQIGGLLGRKFSVVHVVGGGSRNELLCQFTADATGLPVLAGPVEATVAGNILVQALARGDLASPADVRAVVRRSSDLAEYMPEHSDAWDARYARYRELSQR
jgi:rhamnulokinase